MILLDCKNLDEFEVLDEGQVICGLRLELDARLRGRYYLLGQLGQVRKDGTFTVDRWNAIASAEVAARVLKQVAAIDVDEIQYFSGHRLGRPEVDP